jgi:hypothetical protein
MQADGESGSIQKVVENRRYHVQKTLFCALTLVAGFDLLTS